MNVVIRIDYMSGSRISQSASFPLRGRNPEFVALQWWKYLKKENSYRANLELVLANGDDITDQVKELEKKEWNKTEDIDHLPF
jgi:hypothetical protein